MDTGIFEEIGFTKSEAVVYLTLLGIGQSKVGEIIEKSSLQSSVVHNSLNKLIEKGFVSFIKQGKIKHYSSVDPNLIVKYIDSKKEKYLEMLPQLTMRQNLSKQKSDAEVFIGVRGLKSMFEIAFSNCGQLKEFLFFAHPEKQDEELNLFYAGVMADVYHKKIPVRGLASVNSKKILIKEFKNVKNPNIRFLEIPFPSATTIINDYLLISNWGEKPVGIMIHSKEIAQNYRSFFEEMWKVAKR